MACFQVTVCSMILVSGVLFSISCPIKSVIVLIHYRNIKARVVLLCVAAVCVGQDAGRLQTQEQQDQRRSVPLSHRHAEHVSQMLLWYISHIVAKIVEFFISTLLNFIFQVCVNYPKHLGSILYVLFTSLLLLLH